MSTEYFNKSSIYNSIISGNDNILNTPQQLTVIKAYETRMSLSGRKANEENIETQPKITFKTSEEIALAQKINREQDLSILENNGISVENLNNYVINKKIERYIEQRKMAIMSANNIQNKTLVAIA